MVVPREGRELPGFPAAGDVGAWGGVHVGERGVGGESCTWALGRGGGDVSVSGGRGWAGGTWALRGVGARGCARGGRARG